MNWVFNNWGVSSRFPNAEYPPECKHEWIPLSLLNGKSFCRLCDADLDKDGVVTLRPKPVPPLPAAEPSETENTRVEYPLDGY